MKTIVITGSSRGIGYGLARSFLALEQRVVISGSTAQSTETALEKLTREFPPRDIFGHPCDVRDFRQVQNLWDAALDHFNRVDIWINNAGVGTSQTPFQDLSPDWIQKVVSTNVTGAMYGARVALRGMLEQGTGAFYNMEGLGSDGRFVDGLTLYGATKRALNYLTDSLAQEMKDTPVLVGAISPGMVTTDLLIGQYRDRPPEEWERAKRIFNILADKPETVTPWIAERVLKNTRHGARVQWLTGWKAAWRFASAPFLKRDLFREEREG